MVPSLFCQTVDSLLVSSLHNSFKRLNVYTGVAKNFKTPYLPQMGADCPGTKTMFARVPRPIIIEGQVGGAGPPRWRTKNVPRPQKSLNPIFSKILFEIFFKFFMGEGDPNHYRLAEFKRNLFLGSREKFCQIFFQKISLGGPCPPNLTPRPLYLSLIHI